MAAELSSLMSSGDFSFAQVWLLSFFAMMWDFPIFWAMFLSAVFGHYAIQAGRAFVTLMVILPVGKKGLNRFLRFMAVWSYASAQTTLYVPMEKITPIRKLLAIVYVACKLFPGYGQLYKDKQLHKLDEFLQNSPWPGSKVWYNGVGIRLTWYPNFTWVRKDEFMNA